MKTFRKNKWRTWIVSALSQIIILAFSFIFCMWMISGAKAAIQNNLKSIISTQISDHIHTIELLFSEEIDKSKIKTNFERNFLQFSLENTTIFPAKSINVGGEYLDKVFSYQYQPNLVRSRIYLKGDLSHVQSAISWKLENNKIIIAFDKAKILRYSSGSNQNAVSNTVLSPATTKLGDLVSSRVGAADKEAFTKDEERLLKSMEERISNKKTADENSNTDSRSSPSSPPDSLTNLDAVNNGDLFSGMRKDPEKQKASGKGQGEIGFGKVIWNLTLVLGLIALTAYLFRKFVLSKNILGGRNTNEKLIKVITNYSISPGKSISIVRVANEYLVLGLSGNNINLITTLDSDSGVEKKDVTPSQKQGFSGILHDKIQEFESDADGVPQATLSGIRESIKNKIRGFKQLT